MNDRFEEWFAKVLSNSSFAQNYRETFKEFLVACWNAAKADSALGSEITTTIQCSCGAEVICKFTEKLYCSAVCYSCRRVWAPTLSFECIGKSEGNKADYWKSP